MKVTLVGLGSGADAAFTAQAQSVLEQAQLVVGAQRLIQAVNTPAEKCSAVRTEDILRIVKDSAAENICVVFSGDTGFYSGAKKLCAALRSEGIEPALLPGISSVQLLSAALGRPWQDWNLFSAHGGSPDVLEAVCTGKPAFFLTSDGKTPSALCRELCDAGLGALGAAMGENLGTENEKISLGTAADFAEKEFAPLNVLLLEPAPALERRSPGIEDGEFIRGNVPMTKQEVRAAVMAKLAVRPGDVCWDIGAGTGSVSVELALNAQRVYAVEEKPEACALIRANREKFRAWKMKIICGRAGAVLAALPKPDVVFIGGSGGELSLIIGGALEKNSAARICVSAVALETLNTAVACMERHGLDFEVAQISVSRTQVRGGLHMMTAQNPVFLITASAKPEKQPE